MATTNEPLQLNLGSLRSAMSLTLHTHHASRIWHGRAAAEGRPGIVGLNGYIAQMNKMRRGSEQDDPYSDFWMLRIEDKLDQTKTTLQSLREQVDRALASVPPALTLGENLNVQPSSCRCSSMRSSALLPCICWPTTTTSPANSSSRTTPR